MTRKPASLLVIAFLGALLAPGCSTNVQGDEATPVYVTVSANQILSVQNIATSDQDKLRQPEVVLNSKLKDPGAGSSSFLDVKFEDYLVEWERVDGGTRVPASEVFATNILVPAGGTTTINNYGFMSVNAWRLSPIDQLYPFNGGVDRETGRTEIRCRMKLTFRGHTMAGEPVNASGGFDITFIYLASSAAPVAVAEGK